MNDERVTLGFVCVQNAGRSQMATAFAERERSRRGLEDTVHVLTGGTQPAEEVHPEVVEAMAEVDIDLSDRVPQKVSTTDLNNATIVATMGCSTLELNADVEVRDWALDDPHGRSLEEVRRIRDEIQQRVSTLFDEYTSER
ncbi:MULTISPECIES: low molecular weight phosphatase family protein [unclassified Halorubrum]|uniref:arsenate-mycothiol transferase ArsC n=1 Tax=unclassified Halorubrum TaxID=2642239 RepID=UPI000B98C0F7|nr:MULTISPECIES: low molecular weight phosphatase family protein [unclassified Halorubrum]OYR41477.1 low molecular weight phosphatase family protein [Halorubrum sp. Eb13]OYR52867.1 low molecular weight phosphatase family protein [Halorubrum sp. Ea1]